jgi:hypothetical protein
MNKIVNFSILYISLFVAEITGYFLIVLFYYVFESFDIKGSFDSAILWNLWRVLFYGLPFVVLYFILFKYFGNIKLYKPLLYSIFNLSVYISLSLLSRLIWGKNVPLPPEGIMFWTTCISIFLSPIILGQIPYFRRLMVMYQS